MSDQRNGNEKIYTQISLVMGEIGAISKDRQNIEQKYKFRGIDDIYNAVNAALSKHGVFCVPTVEHIERSERTTKSGSTLLFSTLTIKYTFYASDGSFIEARTIGEAMDTGDKSCNKAMSAAQKYVFLQVFCIPTEEPKDTENDTYVIGSLPTITEAQAGTLRRLITDTATDLGKFLLWAKITAIGELPALRFEEARKMLEDKKNTPPTPPASAKEVK